MYYDVYKKSDLVIDVKHIENVHWVQTYSFMQSVQAYIDLRLY